MRGQGDSGKTRHRFAISSARIGIPIAIALIPINISMPMPPADPKQFGSRFGKHPANQRQKPKNCYVSSA